MLDFLFVESIMSYFRCGSSLPSCGDKRPGSANNCAASKIVQMDRTMIAVRSNSPAGPW